MKKKEEYQLKRKNFIEKSIKFFNYLCDEFEYLPPIHSTYKQPNGVIITDSLEYLNESIDRLVIICNAYHPVDYGFEVQLYRPSISTNPPDRIMVYPVLKEDQDIEQAYIEKAAEFVREKYTEVLLGNEWINLP